ncbi:MAG: hypothetical protein OXP71_16075 [Candidatus Poribacteria bacterium]|nr:hypothetical protein [Candidatus Poribacteria bacterium]
MIWLRLFLVFSVCIFLISIIAFVRVNRSISTQSTKDEIVDEAERSDVPNTGVRFTPLTKKTRAPKKISHPVDGQQFEQRVTELNDEQEVFQFQSTEGQIEPGYEIDEADATKSSERQIRIAEIKRQIEQLSEQIKQLEDEESALPPRYPRGQEPTEQMPEEMERDREIATRRRELQLQQAELGKEEYYLSRELRQLQQ